MVETTHYRYTRKTPGAQAEHLWVVVTPRLSMHLFVRDCGAEVQGSRYYGGIEQHWPRPPSWATDTLPTQTNCWIIGGDCWHDGSSLQASEYWIPRWLRAPHDHDAMFAAILMRIEQVVAAEETYNVVESMPCRWCDSEQPKE